MYKRSRLGMGTREGRPRKGRRVMGSAASWGDESGDTLVMAAFASGPSTGVASTCKLALQAKGKGVFGSLGGWGVPPEQCCSPSVAVQAWRGGTGACLLDRGMMDGHTLRLGLLASVLTLVQSLLVVSCSICEHLVGIHEDIVCIVSAHNGKGDDDGVGLGCKQAETSGMLRACMILRVCM